MPQTLGPANTETLNFLAEQAAACWQAALEGGFGSDGFALQPPGADAADDVLWFACDFAPAHVGAIAFGLNASDALALGYRLLAAKGRPSQHDHHALHATAHLIAQCGGSFANRLSARLNLEVAAADCQPQSERPAWPDAFEVPFPPAYGAGHFLSMCASPALLLAFTDAAAPDSIAAIAAGPNSTPRNLDVLLDLEMPVSVSFGSTRLALKDVAKLTSGSIVELNRNLSEPVDIVVNNCPIARGEVVVVDGNFAVRIKHVISKQERLRSLS
jgi:flagellar motor switch protein FliN/FliY